MYSIFIVHVPDFNLTSLSCISMWGKPSNIHTLNFQFFIYIENMRKNIGIPLSFLVLLSWVSPPCYVRQCSTISDSLFNQLVKGLVHTYIISDMSRGKLLHKYMWILVHCNTQPLIFRLLFSFLCLGGILRSMIAQ